MRAPKEFSSELKHLASETRGNTTRSSLSSFPGCQLLSLDTTGHGPSVVLTTSQAANSMAQHSQLLMSAPLNQMPGWLPAAPTCRQELVMAAEGGLQPVLLGVACRLLHLQAE